MQFQAFPDSRRTLFALIISLTDDSNEKLIHSYEQLDYLSIRHCQMKFNMYLLYSKRPKDLQRNYSIQIDVYETIPLTYRGSIFIRLNYPFLPVQRSAGKLAVKIS